MRLHIHLGIDRQDPLLHDLGLEASHGFSCGDDLPVQIGQAHSVIIDQIDGTNAAAYQCLADIPAHAADSKHRHTGLRKAFHGVPSQ